jgi:hypothetical protein
MRVANFLRGLFQRGPQIPSGWTDDMSVPLQGGHTVDQLVRFVEEALKQNPGQNSLLTDLCNEFKLSHDEAELSLDRFSAGIIRARTGSKQNRPNRRKDPIAAASFDREVENRK